jgi:hypothetical protein
MREFLVKERTALRWGWSDGAWRRVNFMGVKTIFMPEHQAAGRA